MGKEGPPVRRVTQGEAAWVAQVEVGSELNLLRAEAEADREQAGLPTLLSHVTREALAKRRQEIRGELETVNELLEPLLERKRALEGELQGINNTFREQSALAKERKREKKLARGTR